MSVNATGVDAIDLDLLPAQLKGIPISQGYLLPTYMFDALSEVLEAFDVIENDGKTPLYTWEFIDNIKKAEDDFNPDKIANITARIPILEDYEIDTSVARSELMSHFRSYQKWMFGLKTLDEALKADFAVYFLQKAMQELIVKKIALKAVWKGIRTATQADRGAEKALTGLIKRITDGRAVGGDIPAGNVFDGNALTVNNAYAEINGTCQLAYNNVDLTGIPLNCYLSPQAWTLYNKNRQALSPNTVKVGEMVTQPDYMPNITFVEQHGLAGKDTLVVTPKSNLKFSVNSNPEHYNVEMMKVMKGYELNILASGGVDYGYGKYLFSNDQI